MKTVSSTPPQMPVENSLAKITAGQNFNLAIAAGIGAALVGAVAWAFVTVATKTELGLMAIAVGFLVGRAIRMTGHGIDQKFGYLGAACALFGCILGNVFSDIGFYADLKGIGFDQALREMDMALLTRLVGGFFKPMDLLFYAIAIYEGYKFSFKYRVVRQPSVPNA